MCSECERNLDWNKTGMQDCPTCHSKWCVWANTRAVRYSANGHPMNELRPGGVFRFPDREELPCPL